MTRLVWLADELRRIQHHRNNHWCMADRHHHLGEQEQMTLLEMVSAVEKLQAIYDSFNDEQTEAKQKIRWAINHLSDKIWTESL